jgi:putative glutamine amidotransferase
MSLPRILVTRAEKVLGERWEDYTDCLERAGAEPVAIDLNDWIAGKKFTNYDGLLLTAGVDIDPSRYGEPSSKYIRETHTERDEFEISLLRDALESDHPVLAICRGHQLFNIAHGGSLLQHLTEREPHRARRGKGSVIASGWHKVTIAEDSRLAKLFCARTLQVNSRHHQAVTPDRVASGLLVAASTGDGVVEALERPDRHWAISVQWHPERDEIATEQKPLFAAFVEACNQIR